MFHQYISLWYFLPADQGEGLPQGVDEIVDNMFSTYGKGEMNLSSRSGYIDYALNEFARHFPIGGLRKLLDPEVGQMAQFRCEIYEGVELQAVATALQEFLSWVGGESALAREVLHEDDPLDVLEALNSNAVGSGDIRGNPAIKWSDDGDGPHVLFTYLRSLHALFVRARAQDAMQLQVKSRG